MKGFLALAGLVAAKATAGEHPIEKVMQMMVDLRVQSKKDGQEDELAHVKTSRHCSNEHESYTAKIASNNEKISELTDSIKGLEATTASLTEQIAKLEKELNKRTADQKKADGIRADEKAAFDQAESDFKDTISAINSALEGLKASKPALASVKKSVKTAAIAASAALSHADHQKIHAFLQQDEEPVAGTGRVREYDFKSGGVIELLEKLVHDFDTQLLDAQKAETNAVNSYDLSSQAQTASIEAAEKSKSKKEENLASDKSDLSSDKQDLNEEEADLKENTKTLKDKMKDCAQKANAYEARAEGRAGEQKAITTAIEILAKTAGVRPPSYDIAKKGSFFLQLAQSSDPRDKAVKLIMASAQLHKNAMMMRLAQQIKVQKGPFQQIKNEIQKMIFRLNKEQTDEDAHKNWCDTEIQTTEQSQADKNEKIESLQAKMDKLESLIADLTEKIAADEAEVAETNQYIKEETEMRTANKKDNAITVADAKTAQKAVSAALAVLTKYYQSSGAVEEEYFLQVSQEKETPKMSAMATGAKDVNFVWTKASVGTGDNAGFSNTDGSNAVLSMLETVLEDFSKLEAETVATETSDQDAYDQDMSDKQIKLTELRQNIKMKSARKSQSEEKLVSTQGTHKKTSNQLEALDQYMLDLGDACASGLSHEERDAKYDERKAARASEIQSLKDALKVLKEAFAESKSFLQRNF
jgi:chromosome segregation ATPase